MRIFLYWGKEMRVFSRKKEIRMIFPQLSWILLLASLALLAVGFYKFTYFFTVGHGLVTGGLGLSILIIALVRGDVTLPLALMCLLLLVYGFYQGGITAILELKKGQGRTLYRSKKEADTPLPVQLALWLLLGVAYLLPIMPLWYREATGPKEAPAAAWIGLALMLGGLALELIAARQANQQRQEDPLHPPMYGLFGVVRCPGQLGRIIFFLGILAGSAPLLKGFQRLISLLGYGAAVYFAFRSARRKEKITEKRHGRLKSYQNYVAETPVILPFIPLYSLDFFRREEEEEEL